MQLWEEKLQPENPSGENWSDLPAAHTSILHLETSENIRTLCTHAMILQEDVESTKYFLNIDRGR